MKKYYVVVGRIIGDDEDMALAYHAANVEEAKAAYIEEMWELEFLGTTEYPCLDRQVEYRAKAEAEDNGCVINNVLVSDCPISILM